MSIRNAIGQTTFAIAIVTGFATFALLPQATPARVREHVQRIYGVIVGVDLARNSLKFQRRNGTIVVVDISQAAAADQLGALPRDTGVVLIGLRGTDNVFHVRSIGHAAPRTEEWSRDTDS